MAELVACAGSQLDPWLVDGLVTVLEREERRPVPVRSTRVAASEPGAPQAQLAALDAAPAAG